MDRNSHIRPDWLPLEYGAFISVTLKPIESVRFLNEPEATLEASRIQPKCYLIHAVPDNVMIHVGEGPGYASGTMMPCGTGPPSVNTIYPVGAFSLSHLFDEGLNMDVFSLDSSTCHPIFPATTPHPFGNRPPLHSSRPLPFPDVHIWHTQTGIAITSVTSVTSATVNPPTFLDYSTDPYLFEVMEGELCDDHGHRPSDNPVETD